VNRLGALLVLSLFLALVFISAPQIGIVAGATGSITIKADGTVSPSDAPILRNDDVYTLTSDINTTGSANAGLLIERDNMTIDGAGYTLRGSSFSGIYLTNISPSMVGRTNVTIKDIRIEGFTFGIQLFQSSNNTISGCAVIRLAAGGSSGMGIFINGYSALSGNNTISGNRVSSFGMGIEIAGSGNDTVYGNTISGNSDRGIYVVASPGTNIISNTVSDNPVGVYIAPGPYIAQSPYVTMKNNVISNNQVNFDIGSLTYSQGSFDLSYDIDSSNTINGKPMYYWRNERDKTVPSDAGFVALVNCTNIKVENLQLSGNGYGMFLFGTTNSKVARNTLTNNRMGVQVWDSIGNEIIENNINANSGWGIEFRGTQTRNVFFRNNFVDNNVNANGTLQVSIDKRYGLGLGNSWDNGKVGNYWSDYKNRYPNATQLGYSGTFNTGFYINENNMDNHPLISPVVLETTPPTVLVASPENKTYASVVSLRFRVSESAPWTGYSLDGQTNTTVMGDTPLTGLAEGSHRIAIYAEDILGNTGFTTVQFTIDRTPPQIRILSPDNGTHSQNVTLTFSTDEPVSGITCSLDGLAAVPTAGNLTLTSLAYGRHNVTVYAKDLVGNAGASETVSFTVAQEGGAPFEFPSTLIVPIAIIAVSVVAVVSAAFLLLRHRKHAGKPKQQPPATNSAAQS
jgi:parallel beta-helix repeat protein